MCKPRTLRWVIKSRRLAAIPTWRAKTSSNRKGRRLSLRPNPRLAPSICSLHSSIATKMVLPLHTWTSSWSIVSQLLWSVWLDRSVKIKNSIKFVRPFNDYLGTNFLFVFLLAHLFSKSIIYGFFFAVNFDQSSYIFIFYTTKVLQKEEGHECLQRLLKYPQITDIRVILKNAYTIECKKEWGILSLYLKNSNKFKNHSLSFLLIPPPILEILLKHDAEHSQGEASSPDKATASQPKSVSNSQPQVHAS